MSKVYYHPNHAFFLTLPDDWHHADLGTTTAFFQPETGVGAMNASAMSLANGTADAARIVLDFTPITMRSDVQVEDLESTVPAAYAEYLYHGDSWRVWAFCGRTRVVVVSYNCPVTSKGFEDKIVDDILLSLVVN